MTTYRVAARIKTKNGKRAWVNKRDLSIESVNEEVRRALAEPEFCWVLVERQGEPTFPGQNR